MELDDVSQVACRLMINSRVDFIIDKMNFYGYDGNYQKAIGFCVTREHAAYMAKEFSNREIESIALIGQDSIDKRQECIKRLEDDNDSLKVIFTVDIFNEGVEVIEKNNKKYRIYAA